MGRSGLTGSGVRWTGWEHKWVSNTRRTARAGAGGAHSMTQPECSTRRWPGTWHRSRPIGPGSATTPALERSAHTSDREEPVMGMLGEDTAMRERATFPRVPPGEPTMHPFSIQRLASDRSLPSGTRRWRATALCHPHPGRAPVAHCGRSESRAS
jgi:hypothetical protein